MYVLVVAVVCRDVEAWLAQGLVLAEGFVLIECKKRQVAWFVSCIPENAVIVEAGGSPVCKTHIVVAQFHHLAVQLLVSHRCRLSIDNLLIQNWNLLHGDLTICQCCIQDEALTEAMPLFGLVLLLLVLLLLVG